MQWPSKNERNLWRKDFASAAGSQDKSHVTAPWRKEMFRFWHDPPRLPLHPKRWRALSWWHIFNLLPPPWTKGSYRNFWILPKKQVLKSRDISTSVSPSLSIYSVTATTMSKSISVPISIKSDKNTKSVDTSALIDSGAGGELLIKIMWNNSQSKNLTDHWRHITWMERKINEEKSLHLLTSQWLSMDEPKTSGSW
jgi:hypothetical protein